MKKILTVLLLILMVSAIIVATEETRRTRKINVKTPATDFKAMIKSLKYDDAAAFFGNFYWGLVSPLIAGFSNAFGYYIYNSQDALTQAAFDTWGYTPAYWFDYLMVPVRETYTEFFGYQDHATAPYPLNH